MTNLEFQNILLVLLSVASFPSIGISKLFGKGYLLDVYFMVCFTPSLSTLYAMVTQVSEDTGRKEPSEKSGEDRKLVTTVKLSGEQCHE